MRRIFISVLILTLLQAGCYYGVLDPSVDIPEMCHLSPGLECVDHRITTYVAELVLLNNLGRDITLMGTTLSETSGKVEFICDTSGEMVQISNNEREGFSIPCKSSGVNIGERYTFDIELQYSYTDSEYTHTVNGEMIATIQ